jgi:hypothetical protein
VRRLLRAVTRPFKRLVRPLRLRLIDYQTAYSAREIERLCDMRDDIHKLQRVQRFKQVKFERLRQQIVKGHA